jgi:hypothetical protein
MIRTALTLAVGSILLDADGECRKLLLHIAGAAVLAQVLFPAAGRFEELG